MRRRAPGDPTFRLADSRHPASSEGQLPAQIVRFQAVERALLRVIGGVIEFGGKRQFT